MDGSILLERVEEMAPHVRLERRTFEEYFEEILRLSNGYRGIAVVFEAIELR